MTGVTSLNANAEVMGRQAALFMNINAAKGLEDVMKTNLGPKGTIKMLVSGSGGRQSSSSTLLQPLLGSQTKRMKHVLIDLLSDQRHAHW